jgi:SAM-dependent methyltransferase
MPSSEPLNLDQLAAYSPWPARLLGLVPWQPKTKTPAEISREFEDEKWGTLWQRVQSSEHPVTLSTLLSWQEDDDHIEFCSRGSDYVKLTAHEANQYWLETVAETIAPSLPASALIELGCGFGNVLLFLARRFGAHIPQFIGGDYTESGVKLLDYLARQEGLGVQSTQCDLAASGMLFLPVPKDAVIYTSYATHYVPHLAPRFVENLCALRPRIIYHFEPCYEHMAVDSVVGLMRQRYIEINDYNRNLVTLLQAEEKAGRIQIISEQRCVFGRNALLPASIIAWKPIAA